MKGDLRCFQGTPLLPLPTTNNTITGWLLRCRGELTWRLWRLVGESENIKKKKNIRWKTDEWEKCMGKKKKNKKEKIFKNHGIRKHCKVWKHCSSEIQVKKTDARNVVDTKSPVDTEWENFSKNDEFEWKWRQYSSGICQATRHCVVGIGIPKGALCVGGLRIHFRREYCVAELSVGQGWGAGAKSKWHGTRVWGRVVG